MPPYQPACSNHGRTVALRGPLAAHIVSVYKQHGTILKSHLLQDPPVGTNGADTSQDRWVAEILSPSST